MCVNNHQQQHQPGAVHYNCTFHALLWCKMIWSCYSLLSIRGEGKILNKQSRYNSRPQNVLQLVKPWPFKPFIVCKLGWKSLSRGWLSLPKNNLFKRSSFSARWLRSEAKFSHRRHENHACRHKKANAWWCHRSIFFRASLLKLKTWTTFWFQQ